jgi:osmotically-inducible protein OsmY
MNDKLLREYVITELDYDPSVESAPHIGVSVENGVVTLSGHVSSFAEKFAAEKAVKRVKGVRAIAQEIEVRYPEQKKTADDQIAQRALAIISWDAMVPNDAVMVKVQDGWVTLSGQVQWNYQRIAAESAVRRLSGVVGVHNDIKVKPRVQPQDVKNKIMEALKRNAELEANAIRVNVSGGKVTLEGKVKSWYEHGVAERAAWSAPGVKAVEDRLVTA